ncbi:Protein CBG27618 [Caenorhabditis briggsae]|uniref:Protein CBG27618 n=1 Tax=Caenorhabditis briggsae TaxID=6238 RepID=B6IJ63_CAEBR|nr:Protein CBG27618 [Caenorhabditis briggsae]CAR99897.1 Protein CBG27618 [Caenorhabditis briggsae]
MGRIRNITIGVILFVLFTGYCWILKNRPTKTESLIFRETNMLPDLTFSKLADLENQMVVELDAVSMEEAGIVVIICVARRFYLQDDYEIDLERVPSTSVLSSQEKLFQGYKTTQN